MTTYDLRISNAMLITPSGPENLDILVKDGVIAALVQPTEQHMADETLDCSGLYVLPGAVDAHVHLGPNITYPRGSVDVLPENTSAAAGGVTTMLAYLMSPKPYEEIFPVARQAMEESSVVDFGFHFCIVSRDQLESVQEYVRDLGVSSFKFFMNFRGEEGAYLGLPGNDDGFLFDLLESCAAAGAMLDPHAENIELVWRLRALETPKGISDLDNWNLSRPDYVEAEALNRLAYLASVTGASIYAVHATSAKALRVLERARETYENVFIETCPHYLTLDVTSPCGTYAKVNPPLRSPEDRDALWAAVADGTVDTIGSDHVPRHRSFKEKDIASASAGFPGLQNLLPLMLSEGHVKRGISLQRIAEVTSTRPAQLFGLYPKKGVIQVGSDADLAVVDLTGTDRIEAVTQFSAADYTPWEGWSVQARVRHTVVRGNVVHRDGKPVHGAVGQYIPRDASGAAALARVR